VDSFASTGSFSSLSIINGNPAISYQEGSNSDLRYVRANNADGTSWDAPIIVDSAGVNGAYTSLEIVNGKPAISYFDAQPNNDLRYVRAANADGTGWDFGIYFEN